MLYRSVTQDRICITQPTHAWVSGQLAQAWGNDSFGAFAPREAVCLGAEQHDIGWLPWEAAPTLNPKTGYPHSFREVAPEVHTKLWAGAKQLAMPMGRYVALLVSLHGTGLYERFTSWQGSPESARVVEAFLKQEKEFQQDLMARLRQDPDYAAHVTPDAIARNQRLVAVWDMLSLAICIGVTEQQQFEAVPLATGDTTLTLTLIGEKRNSEGTRSNSTQLQVEPWCFRVPSVDLLFEGRILKEPALDEKMMQQQLDSAPWVTLTTMLRAA
ncbi:MAG: DUF3891 family protein [Myxacorys californica WJT36-NPBG1]|nr:DUF3891 family protein [Myxacorys californica WJT36-NPBG1]